MSLSNSNSNSNNKRSVGTVLSRKNGHRMFKEIYYEEKIKYVNTQHSAMPSINDALIPKTTSLLMRGSAKYVFLSPINNFAKEFTHSEKILSLKVISCPIEYPTIKDR